MKTDASPLPPPHSAGAAIPLCLARGRAHVQRRRSLPEGLRFGLVDLTSTVLTFRGADEKPVATLLKPGT